MPDPVPERPPYLPPQPAFRRCRCGALVLRTQTGEVVTPLLGLPHECAHPRARQGHAERKEEREKE
jgi:hypothetical protein